jgi:hypothetical protein
MSTRYPFARTLAAPLLAALALAFVSSTALADKQPVVEDTRITTSFDGPPAEFPPSAALLRSLQLRDIIGRFIAGPVGTNGTASLVNLQSECTVAASGLQVVAGFNDFRGSASLSGVIRSADGGNTFVDGGQVPFAGGTSAVQGDPVLAVYNPPSGPPVFYYASIFRPATGFVSLCIHRSTDGGATWAGPFEVTSATHTTATDALEDKEWMTVDPETGRVLVSWTRFLNPSGIQMSVTYSDNAATGLPPTWSVATVLAARPGIDGQGTVVATEPSGPDAYVAWRSTPASGFRQISISRSTDNGSTWSLVPTDLAPSFREVIPAYGMDRFNSFPSLAVNPVDHGLELVYAASVSGLPSSDFGDIYYRRSIDSGSTWSLPVALNTPAGSDRPQIFPTISASDGGRIDAFWYDQSVGSGLSDLSDVFYTYSSDYGASWSSPVPLAPEPRHDELGNNFGAPHQGDYMDAGANGTGVSAAFAWFGDPDPLTNSPDCFVSSIAAPLPVAALRVRPGTIGIADHGCDMNDGQLIAGESADVTLPLENFGRTTLTGISATLTALTPGITLEPGTRTYPDLAVGASAPSTDVYRLMLGVAYPCGTRARFRLDITSSSASPTFVEFSIPTGVITSTVTMLSQNFDTVVPPAFPVGWSLNNGCLGSAGCTSNPWVTTATTPASAPNAAFSADIGSSSFPRLFGPILAVPAGATYVEVTFDAKWNLEQANAAICFDAGSWEYQLNGVGGSRFATSDALEFDNRYDHWTNRTTGAGANGDRWAWSGLSGGYKPIRIRIPATGMTSMQPRWSEVTDSSVGVEGFWVDNVVIKALFVGCGTCLPTPTLVQRFMAEPLDGAVELRWASTSLDVAGWNVYRGWTEGGAYQRVNTDPIAISESGSYRLHDNPGAGTVYYRLAAVMAGGQEVDMGSTSITSGAAGRAFTFALAGSNPFQGRTSLSYTLPARSPVRIDVFSVTGQKVRTLVNRVDDAGTFTVPFELSGARPLNPGMYLVSITAGKDRKTLRVVGLQ